MLTCCGKGSSTRRLDHRRVYYLVYVIFSRGTSLLTDVYVNLHTFPRGAKEFADFHEAINYQTTTSC